MNKKTLLILILALTLVMSLVSCKECEHRDADDDYLCDECGEHFDDGDESTGPETTAIEVTMKLQLENGSALPGINFTLTRGDNTYELISGADGSATISLEAGLYTVDYDYESLPEYCTPDVLFIKVEEGSDSFTLTVTDNKPDGSASKPFFISETETEITLEPGQEIFYSLHAANTRYVSVSHPSVVLSYGGESFAAVDGVASFVITPDSIGVSTAIFSVKNDSAASITVILEVTAPLGSMENPIALDGNSATISVTPQDLIYYSWTADKDGILLLTSPTHRNSISLTNVLENDMVVSSQTAGSACAYLPVRAGDSITLGISAMAPGDDELKEDSSLGTKAIDVELLLTVYAGTSAEPVPVLKDEIDVSLSIGESIVFTAESGKLLTANDESAISVTHADTTLTNENGAIEIELTDSVFILTNSSDHLNGIYFTLSDPEAN